MIVIAADTEAERELLRRLMLSTEYKLGRRIPWRLAAIGGQTLEHVAALVDGGSMSHTDAATVLGCSTRTVRRRVADGTLEQLGRRVTVRSVLAAGGAR